ADVGGTGVRGGDAVSKWHWPGLWLSALSVDTEPARAFGQEAGRRHRQRTPSWAAIRAVDSVPGHAPRSVGQHLVALQCAVADPGPGAHRTPRPSPDHP